MRGIIIKFYLPHDGLYTITEKGQTFISKFNLWILQITFLAGMLRFIFIRILNISILAIS